MGNGGVVGEEKIRLPIPRRTMLSPPQFPILECRSLDHWDKPIFCKKKDLNKLDFGNTNGVWKLRYLKCLLLVNPSNVCAPFSLSLLWSFLADPIPRRGDGEGRKEEEGLMSGRKRGEKVEIEGEDLHNSTC